MGYARRGRALFWVSTAGIISLKQIMEGLHSFILHWHKIHIGTCGDYFLFRTQINEAAHIRFQHEWSAQPHGNEPWGPGRSHEPYRPHGQRRSGAQFTGKREPFFPSCVAPMTMNVRSVCVPGGHWKRIDEHEWNGWPENGESPVHVKETRGIAISNCT